MVNKNKNTLKKMKLPSLASKVAQEAWNYMVMSIVGISSVEANYENKKVILEFQDIMDMIEFLHLTDIIFAGAEAGKHQAVKNN